jgi:hypothetical protein
MSSSTASGVLLTAAALHNTHTEQTAEQEGASPGRAAAIGNWKAAHDNCYASIAGQSQVTNKQRACSRHHS